jgi:alpha-ribazole phosphatase
MILVRHGETDWNAQRRFQGQTDVLLNAVGQRQARALGRRLAGVAPDALYASDLRRAWDTAQAIAAAGGLAVQPEPRLREIDFGAWEGLTYAQIVQRYPEAVAAWQADPSGVAPPQGEALGDLVARVRAALDALIQRHPEETALLVAHGGVLQVLLCLAFDLDPGRRWQFRLDPASVSELSVYPEGPILSSLNDTGHLREGSEWAS